jgi:hypothetical protein
MTVFQISKTKSSAPSVQDAFTFESQPSIHNMLLLDSVVITEQTFTIANGPSITLDHMAVEARLNMDQQFRNHIESIFKKRLPSTVQIQLLFVPTNVNIDSFFLCCHYAFVFRLLLNDSNCNHQKKPSI